MTCELYVPRAKHYVDAMWLMMQHNEPDDFVIATGETHTIREFLDLAFGHLFLDWKSFVETDPRYFRPTEVNLLLGDYSKAKSVLSWEPMTRLDELIRIMVDADLAMAERELFLDRKVGEVTEKGDKSTYQFNQELARLASVPVCATKETSDRDTGASSSGRGRSTASVNHGRTLELSASPLALEMPRVLAEKLVHRRDKHAAVGGDDCSRACNRSQVKQ